MHIVDGIKTNRVKIGNLQVRVIKKCSFKKKLLDNYNTYRVFDHVQRLEHAWRYLDISR